MVLALCGSFCLFYVINLSNELIIPYKVCYTNKKCKIVVCT